MSFLPELSGWGAGSGGEAHLILGRQLGQPQVWEPGWAAEVRLGVGLAGEAGRVCSLVLHTLGTAEREGQKSHSGSDEPGACPPNTGAPAGPPGAATTLEKGK